MSSNGGGGGVTSFLPMAAALAATVMTDGAAAPLLEESLAGTALEGAGATIAGAGIGALAGGTTAAFTGQNVGRSALMGGLAGGAAGYGGMYSGAGDAATATGTAAAPLTGSNVAGTMAAPQASTAMSELATAPTATGSLSPYAEALGSNAQTTAANLGDYWNAIGQTGNAPVLSSAADTTLANATGAGATVPATTSGLGATLAKAAPYALGATALGSVMQQDNKKYGTPSPASEKYSGPLSKFHYDPNNYTPLTTPQPNPPYTPTYANYGAVPYTAAEGGMVPSYADGGLMDPGSEPLDFATGGMYPQSQQYTSAYATPSQMPTSAQATASLYEPKTNPLTGDMMANMAKGGIASVKRYVTGGQTEITPEQMAQMQAQQAAQQQPQYDPYAELQQQAMYSRMSGLPQITPTASAQGGLMNSYAAGGSTLGGYASGGNPRLLEGPGDGMSDNIPATIGAKQPARLADGEFVVPADVVSHLGNGSTDAGAKRLYSMMDKVRKARTGNKKQGKEINAEKYLPT